MFPSSRYIRKAAALTVLAGSIGAAAASCPAHCDFAYETADGKAICRSCWIGYDLSDDATSCEPLADPHCRTPSSQDEKKCETCGTGHWPNSDGVCVSCGDNCLQCADATTCEYCVYAHAFNSDGKCTKCMEHCTQCQDPTTCQFCEHGYGYFNGKCTPCGVDNCLFCTEEVGKCSFCATTHGLTVDEQCEPCSVSDKCTSVQNCYCDSCEQGYKVENYDCVRDETVCLSGQGMKDGQCVPCTLKYCTTCSFDAGGVETCTQCERNPEDGLPSYTSCGKPIDDCTYDDEGNNGGGKGNGALSPRTVFSAVAVVAGLVAANLF
ncbi:hypothetical protein, conserved [Angomonas deanei]|uniref:Uncharacterized protein n=1 Tax=Angomonas deanei TaxID=59799 RepID=A0A7G2CKU8_9TRYP|nr:hypothetical protein, conserved [Angomonas deanei]